MKNIEITVIGPGRVALSNTTVLANSTTSVPWKPGLQLLPDPDVICTRILYNSKDILTEYWYALKNRSSQKLSLVLI